jgi:hypothetical protein
LCVGKSNVPLVQCQRPDIQYDSSEENLNSHSYEVRPRKDKRGVDLISDALPFGRLWYTEVPPYIRSSIATGAWATDIGSGFKKSHLIVTEFVAYGVQKFKANFVSGVRVALGRGIGLTGN